MPHQFVFVLMEDAPADVAAEVARRLAPFDMTLTVPSWKDYSAPNPTHEDESGTYRWTTQNPDGEFESYEIGGMWDGFFPNNICPVKDLPPGFDPGSVVTPDGIWHFFRWRLGGEPLLPQDAETLRQILAQYPKAVGVVVDCRV